MKKISHTTVYGKGVEHWIIGLMAQEGLDVYLPIADDKGIDGIIRKPDGSIVEFQIKSSSQHVLEKDCGLFASVDYYKRPNYYYIFYSGILKTIWIFSSADFRKFASKKSSEKYQIKLNSYKKNIAQAKPEYDDFVISSAKKPLSNFSKFLR